MDRNRLEASKMINELTDEDIFGAVKNELSDEDVFGAQIQDPIDSFSSAAKEFADVKKTYESGVSAYNDFSSLPLSPEDEEERLRLYDGAKNAERLLQDKLRQVEKLRPAYEQKIQEQKQEEISSINKLSENPLTANVVDSILSAREKREQQIAALSQENLGAEEFDQRAKQISEDYSKFYNDSIKQSYKNAEEERLLLRDVLNEKNRAKAGMGRVGVAEAIGSALVGTRETDNVADLATDLGDEYVSGIINKEFGLRDKARGASARVAGAGIIGIPSLAIGTALDAISFLTTGGDANADRIAEMQDLQIRANDGDVQASEQLEAMRKDVQREALVGAIEKLTPEDKFKIQRDYIEAKQNQILSGETPERRQRIVDATDRIMESYEASRFDPESPKAYGAVLPDGTIYFTAKGKEDIGLAVDKLAESGAIPEANKDRYKNYYNEQEAARERAIRGAAVETQTFQNWIKKNPEYSIETDEDTQEALSAFEDSHNTALANAFDVIPGLFRGISSYVTDASVGARLSAIAASDSSDTEKADKMLQIYIEETEALGERGPATTLGGAAEITGNFAAQAIPMVAAKIISLLGPAGKAVEKFAVPTARAYTLAHMGALYAGQGYLEAVGQAVKESGYDSLEEIQEKNPELAERINETGKRAMIDAAKISVTEQIPIEGLVAGIGKFAKKPTTFKRVMEAVALNPAAEISQEIFADTAMQSAQSRYSLENKDIQMMSLGEIGQMYLGILPITGGTAVAARRVDRALERREDAIAKLSENQRRILEAQNAAIEAAERAAQEASSVAPETAAIVAGQATASKEAQNAKIKQVSTQTRTIADAIRDKDTFVFNGQRGAISVEDGVTVFRPFGTQEKYEVPVTPTQTIGEIEGIQWARKGQTRKRDEIVSVETQPIIESAPDITEDDAGQDPDDFDVPAALVEIEKSQTLNDLADLFDTGESRVSQDGKRARKVSQTPEFYRMVSPRQIELGRKLIDNAIRIIDSLNISEEQKSAMAEPFLLLDQDISNYESNPEYKRYKASIVTEVRAAGEAVTIPETETEAEAAIRELEQRSRAEAERLEREAQGRRVAAGQAAFVAPTPTDALGRVARGEAEQNELESLVEQGYAEEYKGQQILTQAGIDLLPETERPRLTPEARKIQIDTGATDAAAEAISKSLRIGVDQVPPDVRMPEGWTLEGDIYIPPQPEAKPVGGRVTVTGARITPAEVDQLSIFDRLFVYATEFLSANPDREKEIKNTVAGMVSRISSMTFNRSKDFQDAVLDKAGDRLMRSLASWKKISGMRIVASAFDDVKNLKRFIAEIESLGKSLTPEEGEEGLGLGEKLSDEQLTPDIVEQRRDAQIKLQGFTVLEKAALSAKLITENLIDRNEAYGYLNDAIESGETAETIQAAIEAAEAKWEEQTGVARPSGQPVSAQAGVAPIETEQEVINKAISNAITQYEATPEAAEAIVNNRPFDSKLSKKLPDGWVVERDSKTNVFFAIPPSLIKLRLAAQTELRRFSILERAALSGLLLEQKLINEIDAEQYIRDASFARFTQGQITAAETEAEAKWNERFGDNGNARAVAGDVQGQDVDLAADEAERAKKPETTSDNALPSSVMFGKTARQALEYLAGLNLGASNLEREGRPLTGVQLVQRAASILAKIPLRLLDADFIKSARGGSRAYRSYSGYIRVPATVRGEKSYVSPRTLVHEIGHTLTADAFRKYVTNQYSNLKGADYLQSLDLALSKDSTPEPVKRLINLYKQTINDLGLTDEYFGANGLAGDDATVSQSRAAKRENINPFTGNLINWYQLYGLSNIHEFVAQAWSSVEFQEMLKSIKTKNEPSAFQKFVKIIKDIFGFDSDTMAAAVIDASFAIADLEVELMNGTSVADRIVATNKISNGEPPSEIAPQEPVVADIWKAPDQEITSSGTSINETKLPSVFTRVKDWVSGTINADIGGGKFDNATNWLADRGVTNLVIDWFNRGRDFNENNISIVRGGNADTATISNVLNVIKEESARNIVIRQAADAIKRDGTAYFYIYEGSGSGKGAKTSKGWQENRKTQSYIEEISRSFGDVRRSGQMIIAKNPIKMIEPMAPPEPSGIESTTQEEVNAILRAREQAKIAQNELVGHSVLDDEIPEEFAQFTEESYENGMSFDDFKYSNNINSQNPAYNQYVSAQWLKLNGGLMPTVKVEGLEISKPEKGTDKAEALRLLKRAISIYDSRSEVRGGKELTYSLGEIMATWMESGLDTPALRNAIVQFTNLDVDVAERAANSFAEVYRLSQDVADAKSRAITRIERGLPAVTNREKAEKRRRLSLEQASGTIDAIAESIRIAFDVNVNKPRTDRATERKQIEEQLRQAKRILREVVPARYLAQELSALEGATGLEGLRKVVDAAQDALGRAMIDNATDRARKAYAKAASAIKKNEIGPDAIATLREFVEKYRTTGLSEDARAKIQEAIAEFDTNPIDALADASKEKYRKRAGELDQIKIDATLGLNALNDIADFINTVLHADKVARGEMLFNKKQNREQIINNSLEEIGRAKQISNSILVRVLRITQGMRGEAILNALGLESIRKLAYESVAIEAYNDQLKNTHALKFALDGAIKDIYGFDIGSRDFDALSNELIEVRGTNLSGETGMIKIRRKELWDILGSLRDPDNMRRAVQSGGYVVENLRSEKLDTVKITADNYIDLLSKATEKDNQLIDFLHNLYNTDLFEMLNDAYVQSYGHGIKKVDSYYPRNADWVTRRVEAQDDLAYNAYVQTRVDDFGPLKERDERARARLVASDAITRMDYHINNDARIAAYLPISKDVDSVLGDPKIKDALIKKVGQKVYRQIVEMARQQMVPARGNPDGILSILSRNVGVGVLGLKIHAAIQNPVGIPIAVSSYGTDAFKYIAKAFPYGLTAASPRNLKQMAAVLGKHAAYYNERYGLGGYAREMTSGIVDTDYRDTRFRRNAEHAALFLLEKTDQWGAYIRYRLAIERVKDTTTLEQGTEAFDRAVSKEWTLMMFRSENTSHGADRTGVFQFAAKNPFAKFFIMFQSAVSKQFSMAAEGLLQIQQGGAKNKREGLTKLVLFGLSVYTSAAISSWFYGFMFPPKDEEEEKKTWIEFFSKMIAAPASAIPVLGNLISTGIENFGAFASGKPEFGIRRPMQIDLISSFTFGVYDTMMQFGKFISDLSDQEINEITGKPKYADSMWTLAKKAFGPVSMLTGVPVTGGIQLWNLFVEKPRETLFGGDQKKRQDVTRKLKEAQKAERPEPIKQEVAKIYFAATEGNSKQFARAFKELKEKRPNISLKDVQDYIRRREEFLIARLADRGEISVKNGDITREEYLENKALLNSTLKVVGRMWTDERLKQSK